MILRFNLYVGNLQQLFRIKNEQDIRKIVFLKKTNNLINGETKAIDICTSREYPYFKNGLLTSHNFKLYSDLHDDKSIVVRNSYCLNKYLKSRGYPLFIDDNMLDKIVNNEVSNILVLGSR